MYLDPKFTFDESEQLTMGLLADVPGEFTWQIINNGDPGNMEQYEVEPDDVFDYPDYIGNGNSNCFSQHKGCEIELGQFLILNDQGEITYS